MEQRGRERNNWEELVKKSIDAEAKASLQPFSIFREMAHEVTAPSTLPWLNPSPPLGIFETSRPRRFKLKTSLHAPCTHILCGPRMVRFPTRSFGKRRRSNVAYITSGPKRTLEFQPPLLMPLTYPMAGLAKTRATLPAIVAMRRDLFEQLSRTQKGCLDKRLVSVLATSVPMTRAAKEATLERVPCI